MVFVMLIKYFDYKFHSLKTNDFYYYIKYIPLLYDAFLLHIQYIQLVALGLYVNLTLTT